MENSYKASRLLIRPDNGPQILPWPAEICLDSIGRKVLSGPGDLDD
jgi:hypothetical protein